MHYVQPEKHLVPEVVDGVIKVLIDADGSTSIEVPRPEPVAFAPWCVRCGKFALRCYCQDQKLNGTHAPIYIEEAS